MESKYLLRQKRREKKKRRGESFIVEIFFCVHEIEEAPVSHTLYLFVYILLWKEEMKKTYCFSISNFFYIFSPNHSNRFRLDRVFILFKTTRRRRRRLSLFLILNLGNIFIINNALAELFYFSQPTVVVS